MPAKDLGTKHLCFKCGTRFYDLKKPEPICPKCGADQRQAPVVKPVSEKRARAAARPVVPIPAEEAEAPEVPEVDGDEDAEEGDEKDPDDADEEES